MSVAVGNFGAVKTLNIGPLLPGQKDTSPVI